MNKVNDEPILRTALLQFIFPFSIKKGVALPLIQQLQDDGFTRFFLDNKEIQNAYYGEDYCVSHERMERTYLPFAAHLLFPSKEDTDTFRRFSKVNNMNCILETQHQSVFFKILSTDIFICPFQLGFMTIRVQLEGDSIPFSVALDFADRFRTLENTFARDDYTYIHYGDQTFEMVENFVFRQLVGGLESYLDQAENNGAYFETLPFFVDDRMHVQAFYEFESDDSFDEISVNLRFRASQLDGLDQNGEPYTSASDPAYIANYCHEHSYNRWGPDTYYMMNEQTFCCLTRAERPVAVSLANQMYGQYYYGLLFNIFHKIVLLKLSNMHARLRIHHDNDEIDNLIYSINKFSAKFYFLELVAQSQGREIFQQMRKIYGNDALFDEVKETLTDLFQYQDKFQSKRRDSLLMILTVFTVVSGIYGMNQVIEDLDGTIEWSKMASYSPFEYLALFVTMSGILISIVLTLRALFSELRRRYRKKHKDLD